ncbi:MAG TPA: hypothetical protein VF498_05730, partial [Anaerolineales bacterium]
MLKHLRWQLTLLYLLATLGLVALLGAGSYTLLQHYFQSSTDLALQYRMATEFQQYNLPLPAELSLARQEWLRQNGHPATSLAFNLPGTATPQPTTNQPTNQPTTNQQPNYPPTSPSLALKTASGESESKNESESKSESESEDLSAPVTAAITPAAAPGQVVLLEFGGHAVLQGQVGGALEVMLQKGVRAGA